VDVDAQRALQEWVCQQISRGRGGFQTRSSAERPDELEVKESRLYPGWTTLSVSEAIEQFQLVPPGR
jgi:hypothetical protein